jgi:hypothetical protein
MSFVPSRPFPAEEAYAFAALGRGEQLIVWSLRAIALGHAECPALRRAYEVALGSSAEEAFTALFLAVRTLGLGATRKLRLHAPGCDCVSADERALVSLLASAQQALGEGDERALRAQMGELVAAPLQTTFLENLQAVASALEVNGYHLLVREQPARVLH